MTQMTAIIATALTGFAATAAQAVPVTFDLTCQTTRCASASVSQSGNLPSTIDFTDTSGLTLTLDGRALVSGRWASSTSTLTSASFADRNITTYRPGIGILSPGDNDHQIDGSGWKDFAEFRFGQQVTLLSVVFAAVGSNDDFRWGYDRTEDGTYGAGDFLSANTDIPGSNTFTGFGGVSSSLFIVGAFERDDEWKLDSVTVDFSPAPVPLPASLLLLLAGVAGLGAIRRRG